MEDNKKYKILFVCLGNICRSPAGQGVMERIVAERGLNDRIFIDSAGISSYHSGWGIVQVGLSLQSHDPSQRSQGFLTLAGGLVITFAKEILDLIMGTGA